MTTTINMITGQIMGRIMGITTGQKGLVPPVLGAWLANMLFSGVALSRLTWVSVPWLGIRAHRLSTRMQRMFQREEED